MSADANRLDHGIGVGDRGGLRGMEFAVNTFVQLPRILRPVAIHKQDIARSKMTQETGT
jgi:hypothetical protein